MVYLCSALLWRRLIYNTLKEKKYIFELETDDDELPFEQVFGRSLI